MRRLIALTLFALLSPLIAIAQVQTPSFTISVQGSYTWSFALGIGDRAALRKVGLMPWVPSLRQGFAASIEGRATKAITIKAKLNSSRGVAFQDFGIYLDTKRWKGILGNFSLSGDYSFAVPRRTLLGAKLAYLGNGFRIVGLASRSLGKFEIRTFRGERGHMETEFYLQDPRRPWETAPYRIDLKGLYYFELLKPYVPDFSEVRLVLYPDESLWNLLGRYDLGYLREILEEDPEREFDFKVINDSGTDVLLLLNTPRNLAKRWIEDAIRAYNERHHLTGNLAKRYPFVPGSSLEDEFLAKFVEFISISVDGTEYKLGSGKRRRYLDLGAEDVVVETLEVEIRLPLEKRFKPLEPDGEFSFRLFPRQGILRIDFPNWFFADSAALKAAFDYSTERNVFVLSPLAGIVPNSERVYRNGRRLKRGMDYTVDYEGGILQLFSPLKEGEEMRVEYEVPHGLGTGPQEDFLGLSFELGEGTRFFLFRSAESIQMTPTTPTMPNDHTVAGLRLSGAGEGWSYSLIVGGSVNIFPPGKNERIPGPNRITDITSVSAPDGTYTVFSHFRGISTFKDGIFNAYRSGRRVYDLLYVPEEGILILAERGGVTIVDLSRSFPFDWRESYTELLLYQEGPGDQQSADLGKEALAVTADTQWIYVATERGLIRFPTADLRALSEISADEDSWRAWRKEYWRVWTKLPAEDRPTSLEATEDGLYLGTEAGLYLREGETWVQIVGIEGPVHRLFELTEPRPPYSPGLYAATAAGIVHVRGVSQVETMAAGVEVLSLAFVGESLLYGTKTGLYGPQGGPLWGIGDPITALEATGLTVWAGTEATSETGGRPDSISIWWVDTKEELVAEYLGSVSRILPTDPDSYRDIPPEGNTDRGLLVQFNWSERLEGGKLTWYISTSTPGYEPIDRPPPGDTHSVGFRFSEEGKGFSLDLQGQVGMRDLFAHPLTNVRGTLSLTWSPGPTLSLRAYPRIQGLGTPSLRSEMGYDLGFAWTNPGKDLLRKATVRVSGGFKGGAAVSGGTVELQTVLGPFGPFTLNISGRRPYLIGGEPTGKESLNASLGGELSLWGLKGAFSWRESWSQDLGPFVADGWRFSRTIAFTPKLEPKKWGKWEFRPSLNIALSTSKAEARFSLKGSPNLGYSAEGGNGRLSLKFEFTRREVFRTGDVAYTVSLSPGVTYTAPSLFRLELSAAGDYELFLPYGSEDARFRTSLKKASLSFVPLFWEGFEPRITATYTPGKVEFSLQRTTLGLGKIPLDVSSKLIWTLGTGNLEGEIKFSTESLQISEGWSLNLEGGYLLSFRPGQRPEQGLFLKGNLALSFSF